MKGVTWFALASACCMPLSGALQAPEVYSVIPQAAVTTPGAKVELFGSGFTPETVVYFEGVQVRETSFVSPSRLDVVTPYLRPGEHNIELKSGGVVASFAIALQALPSPVDAEIDHALLMAKQDHATDALDELEKVAKTSSDYQVKAFARYERGQLYFAMGDWWRWGGETFGIFYKSDLAGMAVQTYWPYRLAMAQVNYLFHTPQDPNFDFKSADYFDKFDVTGSPEPRFYRGVLNARAGNLAKAKADSDSLLRIGPKEPSYIGLAAFVAALRRDKGSSSRLSLKARSLLEDTQGVDVQALRLLGDTAYVSGDSVQAQQDWAAAGQAAPLQADLAYLAGKKHLWLGDRRTAKMLLLESISMAPAGEDAEEARRLLETIPGSTP
ncbi:MAG TPA: IPT/TIG domain-containing protein [Terriglobia bacterium]